MEVFWLARSFGCKNDAIPWAHYSKRLLLKIAGSYPLEPKEAMPHTRNLGGNGEKTVSDLHTQKMKILQIHILYVFITLACLC